MKNLEENILCNLQILGLWNENFFNLWTLELCNLKFNVKFIRFAIISIVQQKKIPFDLQIIELCNEIWRNLFDL